MIGARLDTFRLAKGLSDRSLAWSRSTRPGIEIMNLSLADIRYRVAGNGPQTIVFMADPPNVIEHYDRLIEVLAPTFRVVCLDMPGFGFSYPRMEYNYSVDDQVMIISEFLGNLRLGPYHLAFSCGGAFAGVGIAQKFPDLVAGVINIQAASWEQQAQWAQRVDLMGLIGTPVLGQLLLASAPKWVARKWYDAALPCHEAAAEFQAVGLESIRHGACFCLASGLQQLRSSPRPSLKAVTQPSLVLWGNADRTHRKTQKSSTREHFPSARWHEFECAGHFPELELPEQFAAICRDFISSVR